MDTLQTKLKQLTRNLWWTWRPEVRAIFRDLDTELYRKAHRNPVRVIKEINPSYLERRSEEVDILTRTDRALRQLKEYLHPLTTWGMVHAGTLLSRPVAYFCAEFGLHESIPIYSGGLGILAGDHLN